MICLCPQRIRNKYTGKWMYVPCRKCDNCLIERANNNVRKLTDYCKRFRYNYFVTLTYDNKHIPLLVENSNYLCRLGDDCFPSPQYQVSDDGVHLPDGCIPPVGIDIPGVTGVLCKLDLQLFNKRLRRYLDYHYGKECKYKFFAVGEYGTRSKRPHYHIIFLSDSMSYRQLQSALLSSWKLCDWSKLELDKCIEVSNSACSTYVAAYCNCGFSDNGLFQIKPFKPFTVRSKDINFSTTLEMEEEVRRFVRRESNDRVSEDGRCYFEIYDVSKTGVSSRVLSTDFLYSYFPKFKGFDSLSTDSVRRRLSEIMSYYQTKHKIRNLCGYEIGLSSSDYKCFLGYRRYCNLFNLNPFAYGTILDYQQSYIDVHNYCASQNIRRQMMSYDPCNKVDYYLGLYNSFVEDLDKRVRKMHFKTLSSDDSIWSKYVPNKETRIKQHQYRSLYYKRLLPKHFSNFDG